MILWTTEMLPFLQTAAILMDGKQARAKSRFLEYWCIQDGRKKEKEIIYETQELN